MNFDSYVRRVATPAGLLLGIVTPLFFGYVVGFWWLPGFLLPQRFATVSLVLLIALTFNRLPSKGWRYVRLGPFFRYNVAVLCIAAIGYAYGLFRT